MSKALIGIAVVLALASAANAAFGTAKSVKNIQSAHISKIEKILDEAK